MNLVAVKNLLYRYYEPASGRILIDDHDISRVQHDSLRKQITIISQNPNLFSGSIRDNILQNVADPTRISDQQIYDLINCLGIARFFKSPDAPLHLDMPVGERGSALSGGQQQLVAILRSLINPAPIILLDEITVALDPTTASDVLRGIKQMTQGRHTVMMITHKLAEVENADAIVVLAKGQVAETGTHAELIERGAVYAGLSQQSQDSAFSFTK